MAQQIAEVGDRLILRRVPVSAPTPEPDNEPTLRDELRKAAALDRLRPEWTKRRMPTLRRGVSS